MKIIENHMENTSHKLHTVHKKTGSPTNMWFKIMLQHIKQLLSKWENTCIMHRNALLKPKTLCISLDKKSIIMNDPIIIPNTAGWNNNPPNV